MRTAWREPPRCRSRCPAFAVRSCETGLALTSLDPVDLYVHLLRELQKRIGIDPFLIEDVITDCVLPVGEQTGTSGVMRYLRQRFQSQSLR
jgi:acetyl-CoA acetyltransferase